MTPAGRKALHELRLSQGLDESLPWGGRSPRDLTYSYQRFILEPRGDDATGFADEALIEEQYRRFLQGPGGAGYEEFRTHNEEEG